jgi:hypothetical protein
MDFVTKYRTDKKNLSPRDLEESFFDEIDAWHDSHTTLSLHEYLGLTWEQYKKLAERSSDLKTILERIINNDV